MGPEDWGTAKLVFGGPEFQSRRIKESCRWTVVMITQENVFNATDPHTLKWLK